MKVTDEMLLMMDVLEAEVDLEELQEIEDLDAIEDVKAVKESEESK